MGMMIHVPFRQSFSKPRQGSNQNFICSTHSSTVPMLDMSGSVPCNGTPPAGSSGQSWPGAADSRTAGEAAVAYHLGIWGAGGNSLRGVACIS